MSTREVDFGWWRDDDGRQARLTWSAIGGELYLYHVANGGRSESLASGIDEDAARAFAEQVWPEHSVVAVRSAADEAWPR